MAIKNTSQLLHFSGDLTYEFTYTKSIIPAWLTRLFIIKAIF